MNLEAADYYAILRLSAGATASEIHRAYRTLAMQYHPDRNPAPEAASRMAQINEAYSVLSDPTRRRKYDTQQRMSCSSDMAIPIVAAARAALLRQGWTVLHDEGSYLILENLTRRVRVVFMDCLTNDKLKKLSRQWTEFSVVLAVEVQRPINLSLQIAVIDLVHSKHYGAPLPDASYKTLFQPFLHGSYECS